ncbi:hypothetical protein [Methylocystis sp. S23]
MKIDKSAIFRDAHLRFRQGKRFGIGWTFGHCLSTAWAAAKMRKAAIEAYHSTNRAGRPAREFTIAA